MPLSKAERTRRIEILDEYGGILEPYKVFYIHSIIYSAERAMEAFLRYHECISNGSDPARTVSMIHEALGQVAALSRFFGQCEKIVYTS